MRICVGTQRISLHRHCQVFEPAQEQTAIENPVQGNARMSCSE